MDLLPRLVSCLTNKPAHARAIFTLSKAFSRPRDAPFNRTKHTVFHGRTRHGVPSWPGAYSRRRRDCPGFPDLSPGILTHRNLRYASISSAPRRSAGQPVSRSAGQPVNRHCGQGEGFISVANRLLLITNLKPVPLGIGAIAKDHIPLLRNPQDLAHSYALADQLLAGGLHVINREHDLVRIIR